MFLLTIKPRVNIVKTIPSIHTTLDLKNFDILSICILSDIFETIPSAVPISTSGNKKFVMKFAINVIIKSNTGCIVDAVTKFPC